MRITVVGGGNVGTQFMVHCAAKGHDVIAYTSDPSVFSKHLNIVDENGVTTLEGDISLATNDPGKAFGDAELIMITLPSNLVKGIAQKVYEHAPASAVIGVVPGNGGSECAFEKCIEKGNVFFALERVPAIARLVQKGHTVKSTGYRKELHVAAIPSSKAEECTAIIESIYDKPCRVIPNFLNLTMTPSNPILHTTRLRTIFKDYEPGVVYERLPLFYEEWSDESSELLIKCDEEVQQICHALPEFRLEFVKSLRIHYESPTVEAMTAKISSIPAFKGLKTPYVEVEGGLIPDFHSRYFTADFSYGLSIIKQIAVFAEVDTPNIDEVLAWYERYRVEQAGFSYSDYGINTREDFDRFYLR
ncbi:MAG: NAD/NADP octopine/nopaline dehydrogenase family protein [Saccharofermentans sp.]|nr:NAD/NADP octopine/nopaline dehydrogenase family protein [Saccharofermentans sp.]